MIILRKWEPLGYNWSGLPTDSRVRFLLIKSILMKEEWEGQKGRKETEGWAYYHGDPSNQHLVTLPLLPPYAYIGIVLTLSSFSGSRKLPFYLMMSKTCVRQGNWPKRSRSRVVIVFSRTCRTWKFH